MIRAIVFALVLGCLSTEIAAWDQSDIDAGILNHKMALSADGRYVLVADHLPYSLLVLDAASLQAINVIEVKDNAGNTSRVSAVYTAAPRESFIAALMDIPEIWQISYADEPPVGFEGWVHDYRVDSGENFRAAPFPVRRIKLDNPLGDFFFDEEYVELVGVSPEGRGQVVDLDLGRTIKHIETTGSGCFIHSREDSSFAWFFVSTGPNKGSMDKIDRHTFEVVETWGQVRDCPDCNCN